MLRQFLATLFAGFIGACATAVSSTPTVVEVLPSSYVVDGVSLAKPADLTAYLVERRIHEVRVAPRGNVPYLRLSETLVAIREAGASIGIVGNMQ